MLGQRAEIHAARRSACESHPVADSPLLVTRCGHGIQVRLFHFHEVQLPSLATPVQLPVLDNNIRFSSDGGVAAKRSCLPLSPFFSRTSGAATHLIRTLVRDSLLHRNWLLASQSCCDTRHCPPRSGCRSTSCRCLPVELPGPWTSPGTSRARRPEPSRTRLRGLPREGNFSHVFKNVLPSCCVFTQSTKNSTVSTFMEAEFCFQVRLSSGHLGRCPTWPSYPPPPPFRGCALCVGRPNPFQAALAQAATLAVPDVHRSLNPPRVSGLDVELSVLPSCRRSAAFFSQHSGIVDPLP